MAFQALYLKWRPQRFEDVVGQEHVTQTLKNALRAGRVAHAYLFAGPRGTGKTTMARLLAKAVNCLDDNVDNRPCNECHICRAINEGRLLDLIEMDAASHTGVDNVREAIRDKVGFRPAEARYKVYVIDEVHMLSTSAFNALLKTLEEPPEHVIFCLATTEPHRILPTILSRCQQFHFRRVPIPALTGRLRYIADQEGIAVSDDALRFIARASTGCVRDAISLLDQLSSYGTEITVEQVRAVLGLSDRQLVHELLSRLAAYEVGNGLALINRMVEQGGDVRQFTRQLIESLRGALVLRVGGDEAAADLDDQERAFLSTLAGQMSVRELVRAIKLFNQALLDLRGSDRRQLSLELAFVEAALEPAPSAAAETVAPPPAVASRPVAQEPASSEHRARNASPTPSTASPLPPAPPRTPPTTARPQEQPVEATGEEGVTQDELDARWEEIRRQIRAQSRQVEALVNSALSRWVQDGRQVVFEMPSTLLADKLEKSENKRIVEDALRSVLGRDCVVRGVVQGNDDTPPPNAAKGPSRPPTSVGHRAHSDGRVDMSHDPVVQYLLRRGGKIREDKVKP